MNDIQTLYEYFKNVPTISTDSRNIFPNSIFFALKGETFNGNEYAYQALEKGASLAVVDELSEEIRQISDDPRIFKVANVLETLQQLSSYHRKELNIPIIAITGTNGKTTTKELVSAVLSKKMNVSFTKGNLNNHIGVPLTLLSMNESHDIGVVEMGANHPGEIALLCEIAQPDYGIITNVGKAHLEGFGSFDNIIRTKTELYRYLKKRNGKIFLNIENPILVEHSNDLSTFTYGYSEKANVHGSVTDSNPLISFKWKYSQKDHVVQTSLFGKYNLDNLLAAIAIGIYFKVPESKICEALSKYTPNNNRSQWCEGKYNRLIVDAYNANPTSMNAALDNFLEYDLSPKMAILGDMNELGKDSIAEHKKIIERLTQSSLDKVYLVGPIFKSIDSDFETFSSVDEMIKEISKKPPIGYTILIKGSNSLKLSTLTSYL